MPDKPTKLARAAEIGVSMPTINSWERCGVDIYNDDEVRRRIAKMRNIPPGLKPEFHPKQNDIEVLMASDDPSKIDIEAAIRNLANATDKHQAQTEKTKIDGLLNAWKLRAAAGQYVSVEDVRECHIRIGAIFKASLKRLEADLPPMLEGASPQTMQTIIAEKIDELLRDLQPEYEKAYGAKTED